MAERELACTAESGGSFQNCNGGVDEFVLRQPCLIFRMLAFDFLPLLKSELPSFPFKRRVLQRPGSWALQVLPSLKCV